MSQISPDQTAHGRLFITNYYIDTMGMAILNITPLALKGVNHYLIFIYHVEWIVADYFQEL